MPEPTDNLIPLRWDSNAAERECPTCGAKPGQLCSSPEPDRPGFGIDHSAHVHLDR